MRNYCKALTVAIALSVAAPMTQADAGRQQTNIPAQELESALQTFARERSMQIIFRSKLVKNLKSRPLSGALTREEALEQLLGGTGLTYRYLDDKTVTIYPSGERSPALPSVGKYSGDSAGLARYLADNGYSLVRVTPAGDARSLRLAQVDAPPARPEETGEMEVVSSRIEGMINKGIIPTGSEAPLYYNVIDRDTIERLGVTSMEELFRFIPQTTNPATSLQAAPNNVNVTGGTVPNISRVSLRGFANSQTVILINGRALPRAGTAAGSGTDISRIPVAAIERVEILPSSGSALYGAGAIGGAINIILRKGYQGEDVTAYIGSSTNGGAEEYRLTYLNGASFNAGNTDLTMTLDYQHRGPLYQAERNFLDRALERYPASTTVMAPTGLSVYETYILPAFAGPRATIRVNSPTGDLGIPGAPGARYAMVPLGTTPEQSFALTPASFTQTAGQAATGDRFKHISIYNPVDNYTADAQLEHTFSSRLRVYGGLTLRYMRSDYTYQQPGGSTSGITLSATDPLNPFRVDAMPGFEGRAVTVFFHPADLPASSSLEERTNARLTLGMTGQLTPRWEWSMDVTGDSNRTTSESDNAVNYFSTLQSLTVSTTAPQPAEVRRALYPLLADHSAYPFSGDIDNYWHSLRFSDSRVKNLDLLGRVSGDLMKLPAGNWQTSFLAQYTDFSYAGAQALGTAPGMITLLGLTGSVAGSERNFTEQTRGTTAGAFETVIPVLGGDFRPIPIHSLDLNFGMRYERAHSKGDYVADSSIKTNDVKTATTKVAGLKLQIIPDVALRVSHSEGFYPPDWNEVTQPVSPYMFPGILPDPLRGGTTQGVEFEVVNGGNPNLQPEQSESTNFGLILKPRQLPGLTVSADYWRTKKVDGIQRVIFIDAFARAADYAHLFTRAAPTAEEAAMGWAGIVTSFDQRTTNVSLQETDGVDLQVRYDLDAGAIGSFFINSNVSFTNAFLEQPTVNSNQTNIVGASGPVRWRGYTSVNWTRDRIGFTLTGNYVGKRMTSTTAPSAAYPTANGMDGSHIPSHLLWDTQFTYETPYDMNARGVRALTSGLKVTLGVLNLFDKEPALVTDGTGFYNTYQDPRQRYMYLTLKKSM